MPENHDSAETDVLFPTRPDDPEDDSPIAGSVRAMLADSDADIRAGIESHRLAAIESKMSVDETASQIELLSAWRDTQAWLKITEEMRAEAPSSMGAALPTEVVALALWATRRLGSQAGSLTRSRVMAATQPDSDVVQELARATDHSLQLMREQRDRLRRELTALRDDVEKRIIHGPPLSPIELLERLDQIRGV